MVGLAIQYLVSFMPVFVLLDIVVTIVKKQFHVSYINYQTCNDSIELNIVNTNQMFEVLTQGKESSADCYRNSS